jgi:nicotinamidase-related amidase
MPEKHDDLHGNAPDRSDTVLLLVDVINDFEFPGAEAMIAEAEAAAERIAALASRAREHRIPVVYANDNFGRWRSDWRDVVEHCLRDGVRGQRIASLLQPESDDYFVLKPKHSAFFATTLEVLLDYLEARRIILCGFAGDVCVMFTAQAAFMRDLEVHVPSDCVASLSVEENERALAYLRRVVEADTTPSAEIELPMPQDDPAD